MVASHGSWQLFHNSIKGTIVKMNSQWKPAKGLKQRVGAGCNECICAFYASKPAPLHFYLGRWCNGQEWQELGCQKNYLRVLRNRHGQEIGRAESKSASTNEHQTVISPLMGK